MSTQSVLVEQKSSITYVSLNRPPLNVIDIATLDDLNRAFEQLRRDSSKVIVLGARGKAFSAGVDIKDHTPDKVGSMMTALENVFNSLLALEQPVIAAVQGAALGGGMEFAIACDFIIASEDAKFGQPEIQVGVFPPIACALLPQLLSWPRAMEFVMLGENVTAQQAHSMGLVNRVVPLDKLAEETDNFARKLASLSGPVLKMTKRAARIGQDSTNNFARKMKDLNSFYLNKLMKTDDAQEGLQAFMEKRKPVWKDR